MTRRFFSLMEVMIAIVLLAIMGSIVGFNIQKRVAKKRFHSEMERFKDRVTTAKKLSAAMQADWKGVLKKDSTGWLFEVYCTEVEGRKLKPLHLRDGDIRFNGKKQKLFEIEFYSTGQILPEGIFSFQQGPEKKELLTSDI